MRRISFFVENGWKRGSTTLGDNGWKRGSTILGDSSYWLALSDPVSQELMCRICSLADSAASTFCGAYPNLWPYAALLEIKELPWFSDWFCESRIHREDFQLEGDLDGDDGVSTVDYEDDVVLLLREDARDRFFLEAELILHSLDQRILNEGDALDPLDVLNRFSSDGDKKTLIQVLCISMLCHLNDAILLLERSEFKGLSLSMSTAYQFLCNIQMECESYSSGRVRGGVNRHQKDPKSKDRQLVRQCWEGWVEDPMRYKTLAAFSRDMLQKTEHLAGDPQVIARWVRAWRKGGR